MFEAVAQCRVSTLRQQQEGNSLEAQEKYIYECADHLNAKIVRLWSLNTSSRKGKNLARKDLHEILNYCKAHKRVKYFILDEPDRFMRSVKEYYWWQVEFEQIGVKLAYAKMPELIDQDDPITVMREMFEVFKGEASNYERISKTNDKMRARVAAGYYPFYPHQGYKKTEKRDGLHVPDEPRWTLLQSALRAIAHFEMTPKEALQWLYAQGYRTPKGNRKLDMDHFVNNILLDPYYAGALHVKDWPVNERGLHTPMITRDEHDIIVSIVSGRKIRHKKKYNPDFQLNLALHVDCGNPNAKLCGINHTNGKGWFRKEYVCRTCKKRVPQERVHDSLSDTLSRIRITEDSVEEFFIALQEVWAKQEAVELDNIKQIENHLEVLRKRKNELVTSMATNPELSEDFKDAISSVKAEITDYEAQLVQFSDKDAEFEEFTRYAIGYLENLRSKWWELPGERLQECKQLLFFNEILVSQDGKVYTPKISPIYSLLNEEGSLKAAKNSQLVELAGTAPASIGLSR